jgi:hypothetical protein
VGLAAPDGYDRANKNEILVRHELGSKFEQLLHGKKYGDRAVEQVAVALEVSPAYVYDCCVLSKTWDREELRAFAKRRNKYGHSVSFSHLSVIAKARKSAEEKRQIVERFFKEGLAVRKLRELCAIKRNTPSGPRHPAAGLSKMGRAAEKYVQASDDWEEVFERIADLGPDEKLLEQMKETKEKLAECRRVLDDHHRRLGVLMEEKASEAKSNKPRDHVPPRSRPKNGLRQRNFTPSRPRHTKKANGKRKKASQSVIAE